MDFVLEVHYIATGLGVLTAVAEDTAQQVTDTLSGAQIRFLRTPIELWDDSAVPSPPDRHH